MAVLVTGATGFLGSHLVMALHAMGEDVIATGRQREHLATLSEMGIKTLACDLAKPHESLRTDLQSVQSIVHCAGLSSPWGSGTAFERANVDATQNLVNLASDLHVKRFIFISTGSVYFRYVDQSDLKEGDLPPQFVNAYARTKRQAEQIVLSRPEIGPIVLRPRGIYGAGDTALLPRLMRVAERRPIPVFDPAGATDITHVDDVVAAITCALAVEAKAEGQVMNVSGGVGISLPQIIAAACGHVGIEPRYRKLPFGVAHLAARLLEAGARWLPGQPEPPVTTYTLGILRYRQTMSLQAAQTYLGWQPKVSFEEGLARTFAGGQMRQGVL